MKITFYENLPKKDYQKYHTQFENTGLAIKNGAMIIPTEWAFQNGVFNKQTFQDKKYKFKKIKNSQRNRHNNQGNQKSLEEKISA